MCRYAVEIFRTINSNSGLYVLTSASWELTKYELQATCILVHVIRKNVHFFSQIYLQEELNTIKIMSNLFFPCFYEGK
jgi:hypothetical protein